MATQARFGGRHTLQKLDAIEKYLRTYTTLMKRQNFVKVFFDAFAGTGDLAARSQLPGLFDVEPDERGLIEGSARRALNVEPSFDRYVFVERMKGKAAEKEIEMIRGGEKFPCKLREAVTLTLPLTSFRRTILLFEK